MSPLLFTCTQYYNQKYYKSYDFIKLIWIRSNKVKLKDKQIQNVLKINCN